MAAPHTLRGAPGSMGGTKRSEPQPLRSSEQGVIPPGCGAVPYHCVRYRGFAQDMGKPTLQEHLLKNVFFDTCVYHQAGIDLLTRVIPADNILFASEIVGAVKGIDPETGHYYDDTKRYIDAVTTLSAADKKKIYEDNVYKVYPRLATHIPR
jgi:4-oxalmesaconate hydratase